MNVLRRLTSLIHLYSPPKSDGSRLALRSRKGADRVVSRRISYPISIFVLALTTIVAWAATQTYRDEFSTVSYSNNDGPDNWATSWVESGDDGSPSTGRILIAGGELRLNDLPDSGGTPNIVRTANLTGATSATYTFDYGSSGNLEGSNTLLVQVATSTSGPWTTLQTRTGDATGSSSFDITSFISATTAIRYIVTNLTGGPGEYFSFDNVQISAEFPDPNQITGTVFRDYDADGDLDSREPGVGGVTVTAYDDTNTAIATTTTNSSGAYSLSVTNGTDVRIEFTAIGANFQPGAAGGDSETSVAFTTQPGRAGRLRHQQSGPVLPKRSRSRHLLFSAGAPTLGHR